MSEVQTINKEAILEKAMAKYKERRRGAKVFCVSCGAGTRMPLQKWKQNRKGDAIYICSDCWKVLRNVGEEQFIKALKGEVDES